LNIFEVTIPFGWAEWEFDIINDEIDHTKYPIIIKNSLDEANKEKKQNMLK
jgi:hypothetical protein